MGGTRSTAMDVIRDAVGAKCVPSHPFRAAAAHGRSHHAEPGDAVLSKIERATSMRDLDSPVELDYVGLAVAGMERLYSGGILRRSAIADFASRRDRAARAGLFVHGPGRTHHNDMKERS